MAVALTLAVGRAIWFIAATIGPAFDRCGGFCNVEINGRSVQRCSPTWLDQRRGYGAGDDRSCQWSAARFINPAYECHTNDISLCLIMDFGEKIAGLTAQKSKSIDSISSRKKELDSVSSKLESFRRENNVESAIGIEKRLDEIDSRSEEISKEIHILREKQHNILREKDRISHESAMVEESMRKLSEIEKEHRKQIDEIRLKREEFKKQPPATQL